MRSSSVLTQRSAACSTLMAQRPMARTDLRTKSTSTSVAYLQAHNMSSSYIYLLLTVSSILFKLKMFFERYFVYFIQGETYSLSSASTWAMFAWFKETLTLWVRPAPGLCLLGSGRHILFEFGQHLGYVCLVLGDTYSLSSASTWAMFTCFRETLTLWVRPVLGLCSLGWWDGSWCRASPASRRSDRCTWRRKLSSRVSGCRVWKTKHRITSVTISRLHAISTTT